MNQAALGSLLRQSRAAKQRLTVTSPGGDGGRADPAGLQVFLRRGHLPLVPRQRVTSGPLCAPPTRRRRRLREPEDARALGGPREALREPDRRARRAHTGRAPPIFPGSAPPLSGEAGGGGGAGLRRAVKSSAWLVPRARARAAAEADLPCPASRPAAAAAANSASSRLPATRTRQRRPPHEVARTGTDGGTPQTDPEAFPPQALSRLEGGGGRNPGSYFPAPGAAGWQAEA